jgi:hypothetical protein
MGEKKVTKATAKKTAAPKKTAAKPAVKKTAAAKPAEVVAAKAPEKKSLFKKLFG